MMTRLLAPIAAAAIALVCWTGTARAQDTEPDPDLDAAVRIRFHHVTLQPIALVQVQAIPYVGDDSFIQAGDIAERPGFRLRRGRLGMMGTIERKWVFAISGELATGTTTTAVVHDAYVGYELANYLGFYAGFEDIAFSRSAFMGSGEGALIERPLTVESLAPFHQLGMHVEGHALRNRFGYSFGLYNAFQRTDHFFEGYLENPSPLGNRFDGIAMVGRLEAEPIGQVGPEIEDLEDSKPCFGLGTGYFISNGGTKVTLGFSGDALVKARGFHFLAEGLYNQVRPRSQPTQPTTDITNVSSYGLVGEAGYMVVARKLGLALRFEVLNPNTSVKDESDSWLLTGGASYHFFANTLKAQLDYTHREELHGQSLKNDSVALALQVNLGARRVP